MKDFRIPAGNLKKAFLRRQTTRSDNEDLGTSIELFEIGLHDGQEADLWVDPISIHRRPRDECTVCNSECGEIVIVR